MAPPLLGFNNNVRHNGRIFHIQTEDSGVKHPRIVTHLFADGGRIIKTSRTDYSEHVGREDMATIVRRMMKEQHKAMFIALRAGTLDELLEPNANSSANSRPEPSSSKPRPDAPTAKRPLSNPNLRQSVPPPPPSNTDAAATPSVRQARPSRPPDSRRPRRPSRRPNSHPPAAVDARGRYAASRPAAIFGEATPRENIFGDRVISEQSLDEVILSYLAEDLEGPQK